jgi:hypothetical protein
MAIFSTYSTQTARSKVRNCSSVIFVHAVQTQTADACSHSNATIKAPEGVLAAPDKFHNRFDAGPSGREICQEQSFVFSSIKIVEMVENGNG